MMRAWRPPRERPLHERCSERSRAAVRRSRSALLEQIKAAGVVDSANQPTALLLMALGPEDVSRIRLGPLTPFAIETLRHIHDFFGVAFQIETDDDDGSLLLSCRGVGFRNNSKRVT